MAKLGVITKTQYFGQVWHGEEEGVTWNTVGGIHKDNYPRFMFDNPETKTYWHSDRLTTDGYVTITFDVNIFE